MPETEKLKVLVSELMQVPVETVDASTAFSGVLATSLGRARLDAALRSRFGVTNNGVYTVKTFGDLCRLMGAEVSEANAAQPTASRSQPAVPLSALNHAGIAIGVDIQSADALPEAADYWESEFYQQHFTRQEIAYALLQPNPRESFASAWCAKEALRKADGRWLDVDWQLTELTHAPTGTPTLNSGNQTIPCSVSLSHTAGLAVAVVAMATAETPVQPKTPIPSAEPIALPAAPTSHHALALVLAVVALLISVIAAGFAFHR
jgi:phosphopantetheine--protein transferase-like protein